MLGNYNEIQTNNRASSRRASELEQLQDALDKAGIKARVTDLEGNMATISATDLREYLYAKQECKNRGLESLRA